MTGRLNFTIQKGEYWQRTITIRDGSIPRILTDYTARLTIRDSRAMSGSVLIDLTVGAGITMDPDPTTGRLVLTITEVQTTNFAWTAGEYDLFLIPPDNKAEKILYGSVVAYDQVTQTP